MHQVKELEDLVQQANRQYLVNKIKNKFFLNPNKCRKINKKQE